MDDATAADRLFKAARIIVDPDEVIEDGAVVVRRDRVIWVGPSREAPPVSNVVDFAHLSLLPGLIDAHVHLVWGDDVEPHRRVADEGPILTSLRAVPRLKSHVAAGVTTIRDLGSTDGVAVLLARAVAEHTLVGPRVVAAGRAITMTGGHAWVIGREADGEDAVRAAVRAEIKAGADCIKVMASGGVFGSREEVTQLQFRDRELRAAVEESHAAGLRAAAHAYSSEAIRNTVEAGIDTVEHGSFLDGDAADLMQRRGVYLVNTLSVTRRIAQEGVEMGASDAYVRKAAAVADAGRRAFRLARERGVPLAVGTDSGGIFQRHGSIVNELAVMVEYGATPREVLGYATQGGAMALGVNDDRGTLRPGKAADFVVVDGDPTSDVSALASVRFVMIGGRELYSGTPTQLEPARSG